MERKYSTVLFDLDGTLLPMDYDAFFNVYFNALSSSLDCFGFSRQVQMQALMAGIETMMRNDGSRTNREAFWSVYENKLGTTEAQIIDVINHFYSEVFPTLQSGAGYNPLSNKIVEVLKAKGYTLALATNPMFPTTATEQRVKWAGLNWDDFAAISCYEDYHFCKPNPDYFRELLHNINRQPQECLMVGNDTSEDGSCLLAGIECVIINDCLIDKKQIATIPKKSLQEFYEDVQNWDDVT
ncbi:MAG: HAD family hydrolase [Erysipelotrichaceae bacterium]|nr:HAD family hydrolase [Erysipelotrichaceae bacterium]